MVSPPRARSIAGITLAGIISVAALAGCTTGSQAGVHTSIAGTNGELGNIAIRNAFITITGPGEGTLEVALFNQGDAADTLTGITSSGFTGVSFPGAATLSSADAAVTAPPTGTAEPATNLTTASSVDLPTTGGVFLNTADTTIKLSGVKDAPLAGSSLGVTLTFADAGSIDLQLPIVSSAIAPPASDPAFPDIGSSIAGQHD